MDGFWSLTDSGVFQIDGSTMNFSLREHFAATTSKQDMPVGGSNFGRVYSVIADCYLYTFNAVNPIIALWTDNAGAPVTVIWCKQVGSNVWQALLWASAPTTFEVFLFDQTQSLGAGGNIGIKVYDPQGRLIADPVTYPMMQPFSWRDNRPYGEGWKVVGFPRPYDEDWSDRSRRKIAVGGIKTGAYADGVTSANTSGKNADARIMISCWHMDASGGCFFHWKERVYNNPRGMPGNASYFAEALNSSCILIDVSNFS